MRSQVLPDDVEIRRNIWWVYYLDPDKVEQLDPDCCGKWMMFFTDVDLAEDVCLEAASRHVVVECKHTSPEVLATRGTGVACFYLDGTDTEAHRRVLAFMLAEDLVPRDGDGRLVDIPFKYDWQTREGQYGDRFVPEVTLSDFVDLDTGELLA